LKKEIYDYLPRLNHALVAVGAILFLLPISATFAQARASNLRQPPHLHHSEASVRRSLEEGYPILLDGKPLLFIHKWLALVCRVGCSNK
jgi:hypothetical protein